MLQEQIAPVVRGYELREPIGEGGYGMVFRAYQPLVDREVAVKIIRPQYANHPDFIRRFESEAQLVARLEHPYIVPLYDYWREPDGAYLVMRYLRGGSLHDLIHSGPVSLQQIDRLLEQVGGALAVAHRRGVVHRDLKPANILLDEDGNAYLADFGIAKDIGKPVSPFQTDQHTVIGSPAYLAPEQVKAEPITPQTDIYSLGVTLYEILTGRLPFDAQTPVALMFKHVHEPVPPVGDIRPDLPADVNAVLQRAMAKHPAERYPDVTVMVRELRQALTLVPHVTQRLLDLPPTPGASPTPSPPIDLTTSGATTRSTYDTARLYLPTELLPEAVENPYKGLRAFQEADAADFFGRDVLTQLLLARLQEPHPFARFLAVVGPSGSGKSSVVRAGLIPALKRGALPGSENWFVLEMFPGAHPIEELARALLKIAVNPPNDLIAPLQIDDQGLLWVVDQVVPGGEETEVVLVIDQFEELFTLVEDERASLHFLNTLLTTVTDPHSRVRVVITLRADFYDRPLLYPRFSELMRQRTEVVVPLAEDELKAAIVRPAERHGLHVDGELVEAILADVGAQPGALPLLQYALTEVFARRSGPILTITPYHASGGVLGALGRRAEELYIELTAEQQEAARQLFLRLVTPGEGVEDTRRRVRRAELIPAGNDSHALDAVVERYSAYRLLTLDRDPQTREPTVQVAHEALLRTWQRLRTWVDASREDLRGARRLAAAAREWAASGQEASFLARGARLEQFAALADETALVLNAEERAYLEASLAARAAAEAAETARAEHEAALERRSRAFLRALVGVASLAAVIGLALALYAFGQRRDARNNEQRALMGEQQAQWNAATAVAAKDLEQRAAEEARRQRQLAEQSARQARNLALSAGAQAALNKGDTDAALALAMAANRNEDRVIQAEEILSEAAYARGARRVFKGMEKAPLAVAFSPDGETVLSGGEDQFLRLWDIATAQPMRTFKGHTDKINSVVFSPTGATALSASADQTLILWRVATGELITIFQGHTAPINDVAFSPDGKTALSGSDDTSLILWDVETGRLIRKLAGHTQQVQAVTFSPDGQTALSASSDTTLRLWNIATGETIRTFEGHTRMVFDVAFSPDGKTALSSSEDTLVLLWDVETGKTLRTLKGHTSDVWHVVFSPDGKTALSSSRDTRLGVWNVATGDLLLFLNGHGGSVRGLAYSPDGRQAISASIDKSLRLWDLTTGGETRRFSGHTDAVNRVVVSPDGATALSAGSDNMLRLWNIGTGQVIHEMPGHASGIFGAAISPDGKTALSGASDQTVIVWDLVSGQVKQVLNGHTRGISAVAISPDGKTALSSSVDKTLIHWNLETGQIINTLLGHTGDVYGVAFSPDGQTALSASGDGTLIQWDLQTGKGLRTLKGHSAAVRSVVFSADGKAALSGGDDKLLLLWDLASGQPIRRFVGHSATVRDVAFSPKGDTVLSGSSDSDVILWDRATGQPIRRFSGHTGIVRSVAFSRDGQLALSASVDKTVRQWRIDSLPELISWTEANRHVPELSCDQERYYELEPSHC